MHKQRMVVADGPHRLWLIWDDIAYQFSLTSFLRRSERHAELANAGVLAAAMLRPDGCVVWPNGVTLDPREEAGEGGESWDAVLVMTVPAAWAYRPLRLLLRGLVPIQGDLRGAGERDVRTAGYGLDRDEWEHLMAAVCRQGQALAAPRNLALLRLRDLAGVLRTVEPDLPAGLRRDYPELPGSEGRPGSLLGCLLAGQIDAVEDWLSLAVKREQQRRLKVKAPPCFIPGLVF
ncbi:hypothetical protein GCM10008955_17430 [Deinococcus malanensis]|uniref:Uncharacterized protein n=1 Tax=Deinococcus malanensis TaxID=1706855 RepID=A0ABQ2ETL0_9DEIO|nr:hypothetical protein [Deinococcus malanensis]GGK24368.1 hypothetical protein GCM10008955_17430 [Deinococcus malanensis]